MTSAER